MSAYGGEKGLLVEKDEVDGEDVSEGEASYGRDEGREGVGLPGLVPVQGERCGAEDSCGGRRKHGPE